MMTRFGTELELISNRIKRGVRNGKFTLGEVQTSLSQKAKRAVSQTDYYVHDNAWKLMGAAAALSFLGGIFLARKISEKEQVESGDSFDLATRPKPSITIPEVVQCAIPVTILLIRAIQAARSRRVSL